MSIIVLASDTDTLTQNDIKEVKTMELEKLIIAVEKELGKYLLCDKQLLSDIAIEVVARMFVLSFGTLKPTDGMTNNIHNVIYKDYGDQSIFESKLKMARRSEQKLRAQHNDMLKELGADKRFYVSDENQRRRGRFYDRPNLNLVTTYDGTHREIIRYIIEKRAHDSKKFSDKAFVKAYDALDEYYEKLKMITDKLDYVLKWVDVCRMETRYHLCLIPKIAEYMVSNPNFRSEFESGGLDIYSVIFWCNIEQIEAYQLLRYENYLSYFNSNNVENECEIIFLERLIECTVRNELQEKADEIFQPFFDEKENAIEEMYRFCHDTYPVIESHKPSGFYISDDKSLNRPKIKCARKIIKFFLASETKGEKF